MNLKKSLKFDILSKVMSYSNNATGQTCRAVVGKRLGISILNMTFVKYNLIKLYSLLNNMLAASPALNIYIFSINYNYEHILTEFSKESIITLCNK
jgi:hypothetical protein